MKQYQLDGSKLTLKVKKSPIIIRALMFIFAFLSFSLPLTGMILYIAMGNGLHFGFFVGLFLFGAIGFYLLRIALWNTYGTEIIVFSTKQIDYSADFGWFKGSPKTIKITDPLRFSIHDAGYEEDNNGMLVIGDEEDYIVCVTKMKKYELLELIEQLLEIDKLRQMKNL